MAAPEAAPGGDQWDPYRCLDFAADGVRMEDLIEKLTAFALEGDLDPPAGGDGPTRAAHLCPACGCALEARVAYLENVCPECGLVREAAETSEDGPAQPDRALQGRLRVVGRDASYYQPDLDRTNPADTVLIQKQALLKELVGYNNDYVDRGGCAFPEIVLAAVADHYQVVKSHCVRRSNRKREIIAALLFQTCLVEGFTRKKDECANFAQLPRLGVAKGRDYIRMVCEDRARAGPESGAPTLEIDLDCDQIIPLFNTAIHQLELPGGPPAYARQLAATKSLVAKAIQSHIGISSNLRTKVLTAAYEILRRSGAPVTLDRFVQACEIRKNTMNHFLGDLADFHERHFAAVYAEHRLPADPPPAATRRM